MKKLVSLLGVVIIFLSTSCVGQVSPIAPGSGPTTIELRVKNPQMVASLYTSSTSDNAVYCDVSPKNGYADHDNITKKAKKHYWVIDMVDDFNNKYKVMVQKSKLGEMNSSSQIWTVDYSPIPFGSSSVYGVEINGQVIPVLNTDFGNTLYHYIIM
jgi:hypothetical protein